jgi:hypothetical protein
MANVNSSTPDLSELTSSSSSSINRNHDSEILISSEVIRYANSVSFPPIIITGTPAFSSQSSPDIVNFLRSLVTTHPTSTGLSNTSWRLNNQHQLLLFAPTREIFSVLYTHTYPSSIGTSSIQVMRPRRIPAQLSLLLLNVPCYIDDQYLLDEIQKQFRSVKSLHRIRTSSTTNNSTLVRIDFELAQECDQCLQAKYLSVANVRLVVKQYLGPPRIPQCQKCCAFGHFASQCRSPNKICGKCATPILSDTTHQCSSPRCINCSKLSNHPFDLNHDAYDPRCPSMLHYKKVLVAKLVEQGTISSHIYVPKELQLRLRQVREHLQQANIISSPPLPFTPLRHNVWNTTDITLPSPTSRDVIISQSSPPFSNFTDFIKNTVQPFDDQLSNLAKQMTNVTVLSVIQEHKLDYVSSLVEKIMLPSFKLITETLPALIRLVPDSSMHVKKREELSNRLQQTSIFLHTAFEQHQNFKTSMEQTRALMIDSTTMNSFTNRSLPVASSTLDTDTIFSLTS